MERNRKISRKWREIIEYSIFSKILSTNEKETSSWQLWTIANFLQSENPQAAVCHEVISVYAMCMPWEAFHSWTYDEQEVSVFSFYILITMS